MPILSKATNRFKSIPLKLSMILFHRTKRTRTKFLNFIWNHKRPRIVKAILRKNNRAGGITLQDFTPYYKATVIKAVWYWNKSRYVDQWNRIESPEINPYPYDQLIYDKAGKIIQWQKVSPTRVAGKTGQL